ncbi:GNAT family N-acetyltransferase [Flexibacterium corallicola]|uniref:GNAT family N-acetyltransferase n=1 Tax=Flexibacterium corallicola TaxID=3037259 RepID=UPI00286F3F02|nr:GNAT family N-acetyltransferase [Pseudovibrio sp. M1P-2-3]
MAEPHDLNDVLSIMSGGAIAQRRKLETVNLENYRSAFKEILGAPETQIYVGVVNDGEVVSTYQLTFLKRLSFEGRPRASIESFHTKEEWRGKGIGKQMLDHAYQKTVAHGCCLVELTSNALRLNAHRFYERYGFKQSHLGFKLEL